MLILNFCLSISGLITGSNLQEIHQRGSGYHGRETVLVNRSHEAIWHPSQRFKGLYIGICE